MDKAAGDTKGIRNLANGAVMGPQRANPRAKNRAIPCRGSMKRAVVSFGVRDELRIFRRHDRGADSLIISSDDIDL